MSGGSEHAQRAESQAADAVRVMAGPAALDLLHPALDSAGLGGVGVALGDRVVRPRDGIEAMDAGAALVGRLAGEPVEQPSRFVYPAGTLAEREQHPGAECATGGAQLGAGQAELQSLGSADPGAEVAAD